MDLSPRKSTLRVIDLLHSQIDDLKTELEHLKLSNDEYRKKNAILSTKNDSLVDQLANYKHENDMINALLKRKERRITDLETEFEDLSASSDALKHLVKNYKIRCENLQELSAVSTAETERLKISYDALALSHNEYKRHYQEEVNKLAQQLATYREDTVKSMAELLAELENNDKDVEALLEGLTNKKKAMDTIYVARNKAIIGLLLLLANVAKSHGEECKHFLQDNVSVISALKEKLPDMLKEIPDREETKIDIDALLSESLACLELPGELLQEEKTPSRLDSVKRRHKRNSLRASPEAERLDFLPKQRQSSRGPRSVSSDGSFGLQRQSLRRQPSNSHKGLPPNRSHTPAKGNRVMSQPGSKLPNLNGGGQSQQTNAEAQRNKRRLFHGGSNYYNSGSGDRRSNSKPNNAPSPR